MANNNNINCVFEMYKLFNLPKGSKVVHFDNTINKLINPEINLPNGMAIIEIKCNGINKIQHHKMRNESGMANRLANRK